MKDRFEMFEPFMGEHIVTSNYDDFIKGVRKAVDELKQLGIDDETNRQQIKVLEFITSLPHDDVKRILQHGAEYMLLLMQGLAMSFPNPLHMLSVLRQAYLYGYMVGSCGDVPKSFTKE